MVFMLGTMGHRGVEGDVVGRGNANLDLDLPQASPKPLEVHEEKGQDLHTKQDLALETNQLQIHHTQL